MNQAGDPFAAGPCVAGCAFPPLAISVVPRARAITPAKLRIFIFDLI
jgi:hypothetical protein